MASYYSQGPLSASERCPWSDSPPEMWSTHAVRQPPLPRPTWSNLAVDGDLHPYGGDFMRAGEQAQVLHNEED
jgi:hypothetical protein